MENKTSKNILLTIMGVLILAEIAIAVFACISGMVAADEFVDLIALIGVALYGFLLYKKPHGNILKYAMLLSALSIVISSILSIYEWEDMFIEVFPPVFAACLLFYVAGRLNRIEQNKYLLPVIALVLLVGRIFELVSISADSDSLSVIRRYLEAPRQFITVLTLMIAYFVRYKEHKEAGVMDAPKA